MNVYRTNTYEAPESDCTSEPVAPRRGIYWRIASGTLGAHVLFGLLVAGCGMSQAQLDKTLADGEKVASCIIGTVLGGVTDPVQVGATCYNTLPAVIADVIDDAEAKQASAAAKAMGSTDAGAANVAAAATRAFSANEKALLDEAKQKAASLAQASKAH